MSPYEMFYGEKVPPLIKPHEISGDLLQLSENVPLKQLESQPDVVEARRAAMQQLAHQRLTDYHRKLEEQYAGCAHKGAVQAKDNNL